MEQCWPWIDYNSAALFFSLLPPDLVRWIKQKWMPPKRFVPFYADDFIAVVETHRQLNTIVRINGIRCRYTKENTWRFSEKNQVIGSFFYNTHCRVYQYYECVRYGPVYQQSRLLKQDFVEEIEQHNAYEIGRYYKNGLADGAEITMPSLLAAKRQWREGYYLDRTVNSEEDHDSE